MPLDGTLLTHGTFDESALTGEPLPVYRSIADEVASGVVVADGEVQLVTTQTSQTSTYAALVRLVQQAQAESSSAVRIANRLAVWFVPFAIALALGTWLVSQNYEVAVAVIVAATPCPWILAVPVAIISGLSRAASRGAIIKGGAALEQLARAKVVLLDKTGTLTHGGPQVTNVAYAPGVDSKWALRLVASLEQHSPHVVAKSIVGLAALQQIKLKTATSVSEQHGTGLSGQVDGHQVSAEQPKGGLPKWANLDDSLLVSVTVDGRLVAVIGMDDPVRVDSVQTVKDLRRLGVTKIILVSGDRRATVEAVAKAVGISEFHADCKPEQKLALLNRERLEATGTVIAVGDGINDAPALAAADVGVAMGARGSTAASEAADVVIIEDSIAHLAVAIDVAQGARARALQASGVGMGLAVAAMLVCAFGFLNATEAAVSQEFIDAFAILWALVPAVSKLSRSPHSV